MKPWADSVEARLAKMDAFMARHQSARSGIDVRDSLEDARRITRSSRIFVTIQIDLKQEIAYPIGSLYFTTLAANPATILGFGTWAVFGAGRVLIGLDSGDTDFDAIEETGGAKTVASAGSVSQPTFAGDPLATHTHGIGTIAAAAESAHTHSVTSNVTGSITPAGTIAWPAGVPTFSGSALATHQHGIGTYAAANESTHTHSVTSNVAVADHSFTQPTIAWPASVPVAANESAHTHSVTTNVTVADHSAHTHSVTSNVTVDDHSHSHTFTSSSNSATPDLLAAELGASGVAASGTTSTEILSHTVTNNAVTSGNPSATLSHSVTNNAVASGGGSAHTHTISWPASVPTASSGAVDAHGVTNNAVTSGAGAAHTHTLSGSSEAVTAGTPAGTIAWPAGVPTFTGTTDQAVTMVNNAVTSGAGSSHTHTLSGTSDATSGGTPSGTVSQPTYTGSATSVVQPYVVVRIYKRTA